MKHTLESIAKLAGVSRGTVSRVVNGQPGVKEASRQAVLRIIEETGYYPNAQARSLAGGRTENIGVVVFGLHPNVLSHHIFYEVLQGIQTYSAANDYDMLLFANRSVTDQDYWKRIGERRKVDGLIIMGEQIRKEYLQYFRKLGIPFVLVGKRIYDGLPLQCVTSDYRSGAYQAARHLIARGRRKLAYVQGLLDTYHENERYTGFALALEEAGIALDRERLIAGEAMEEQAYARMNAQLRSGVQVDGVFAGNDLMAIGAIKALRDNDLRVPEDVSVVGYDDIQAAAYHSPPITTVRQDKQRLGMEALDLLLAIIRGDCDQHEPKDVMISSELIIREST